MANEMTPAEFKAARDAVQQQGWFLTEKHLGGGGGGNTFLCVRTDIIKTVRVHAGKMQEQNLNTQLSSGAAFIQQIVKTLDPASDYFAVFKSAKNADGRMKREIKAFTNCKHPNLVRIFTSDPSDEPIWYLMEYFRRGDLESRWAEYQGQPLEVLKRVRELASALAVVHDAKLVHRDIKPANIFLGDDGRWVLGDFGIAFELGGTRHTEAGVPMTKEWRPDWVVARRLEDYPPAVALFLLAKVLYALIAGPGKNPPASQLEEPEFDLRSLYPQVRHIDAIQQFVLDHVAVREREMKSKDAKAFIARLDELIARFDWRPSQHQIFSFVSSHSLTHVTEGGLWQFQGLRVLFPPGAKRIRGSVRLHQEDSTMAASISISFRDQNLAEVAKPAHGLHVHSAPPNSSGHWIDFEAPIAEGTKPGWYSFGVERLTGGVVITALLLYVDSLA